MCCCPAPDPVEQLMVYKKGRRMLGLRWAAPKQTYGSLKSFTISYQMPGQDKRNVKSEIKPTFCPAWPHLYCHTLNGLLPDTVYTVLVSIHFSGNSRYTEIFYCCVFISSRLNRLSTEKCMYSTYFGKALYTDNAAVHSEQHDFKEHELLAANITFLDIIHCPVFI
jgi:hypothetical protein